MLSSPPTTQTPGHVTIYPELLKLGLYPVKHSTPRIALLKPKWMVTVISAPNRDHWLLTSLGMHGSTCPRCGTSILPHYRALVDWWHSHHQNTPITSTVSQCTSSIPHGKTQAFWNHRWWQPCDRTTSTLRLLEIWVSWPVTGFLYTCPYVFIRAPPYLRLTALPIGRVLQLPITKDILG